MSIIYRASWTCVRCLKQTKTMAYGGVKAIGDLQPTGWSVVGNDALCFECARGRAPVADDRAALPASASSLVAS